MHYKYVAEDLYRAAGTIKMALESKLGNTYSKQEMLTGPKGVFAGDCISGDRDAVTGC